MITGDWIPSRKKVDVEAARRVGDVLTTTEMGMRAGSRRVWSCCWHSPA